MRKEVYICDRCGKEIHVEDVHIIDISKFNDIMATELVDKFDLCPVCYAKLRDTYMNPEPAKSGIERITFGSK